MFATHLHNSRLRGVWPTCYFLCLFACFRLCRTFVSSTHQQSTININKEQQRTAAIIMNKQPDTWAISTFHIISARMRMVKWSATNANFYYCGRQLVPSVHNAQCSWPSTSIRGSLRRVQSKNSNRECILSFYLPSMHSHFRTIDKLHWTSRALSLLARSQFNENLVSPEPAKLMHNVTQCGQMSALKLNYECSTLVIGGANAYAIKGKDIEQMRKIMPKLCEKNMRECNYCWVALSRNGTLRNVLRITCCCCINRVHS